MVTAVNRCGGRAVHEVAPTVSNMRMPYAAARSGYWLAGEKYADVDVELASSAGEAIGVTSGLL